MTDEQLRDILNQELAKFAGQLSRSLNARLDRLEAKLDSKADAERIYQTLDRIAERLDDDDKERAAMNAQLDRHERWHHQTADTLHLKLDY
jgi:hypothetical protein